MGCLQKARPPIPAACPVAVRKLIKRCWANNPHKRPQFEEIVTVLESYLESLEQDPDYFQSSAPHRKFTLLQCLPKCIEANR